MIDQAITALLMGYTPLTDLIGDRLYPDKLPQACTLPCVVFEQIADVVHFQMEGPSGTESPRFQFSCFGNGASEALLVRRRVKQRLNGFAGAIAIASSPPVIVRVQGVFPDMATSAYPASLENAGPRTFCKTIDFTFWFSQEETD